MVGTTHIHTLTSSVGCWGSYYTLHIVNNNRPDLCDCLTSFAFAWLHRVFYWQSQKKSFFFFYPKMFSSCCANYIIRNMVTCRDIAKHFFFRQFFVIKRLLLGSTIELFLWLRESFLWKEKKLWKFLSRSERLAHAKFIFAPKTFMEGRI